MHYLDHSAASPSGVPAGPQMLDVAACGCAAPLPLSAVTLTNCTFLVAYMVIV
jgi:hypothetical protein